MAKFTLKIKISQRKADFMRIRDIFVKNIFNL